MTSVISDLLTLSLTLLSVTLIDGLLSVDNALVLAVVVEHLPAPERTKALRYGILGAYVMRGASLFFASMLIGFWPIKLLGGAYLVWLAVSNLYSNIKEGSVPRRIHPSRGFWATVIKTEESSLTALKLGGVGAMERLYTLLVISMGLAIFLLAMINERQREFGAMRALGANLQHLRRFLFAEAATIGGLSIVIGVSVGMLLAWLLVTLLCVIFTLPAQGVALSGIELGGLVLPMIVGMLVSTFLSARRLASLKVVEALREL